MLSLNLDNILSFDEDFKPDTYFSLKMAFKTFNGGWLKADLLTFVYVVYSVYVVFVCNITENTKCTISSICFAFVWHGVKVLFNLWLLDIWPSIWKTFNQRLTYVSNF